VSLLVLDDEPWNMSWLEDFAASEGVELRMVSTYDEAVQEASKEAPDIAVVDIMIGATSEEVVGVTLASVPAEWVGLRFVRYLRATLARSKDKTAIIVYTVLDRDELAKVVEDAFQGVYCVKSNVEHFRGTLLAAVARFKQK